MLAARLSLVGVIGLEVLESCHGEWTELPSERKREGTVVGIPHLLWKEDKWIGKIKHVDWGQTVIVLGGEEAGLISGEALLEATKVRHDTQHTARC